MQSLFLLCLIAATSFSLNAKEGSFNLGPVFGLARGDYKEAKSQVAYGGSLGYFINKDWEIGLTVFSTKEEEEALGKTWIYRDTPVLLKSNFFQHDLVPGLYYGLKIGIVSRDLTYAGKENDSYSATSFAYGAELGYRHHFLDSLSLGLSGSFIKANKTEKVVREGGNDVTITFKKVSYRSLLMELLYHF